jgi:uncharacterized protein (TIGR03435 family)
MLFCTGVSSVALAAWQQSAEFDAASVKVNKTGDARTGGVLAGNRFSMINETAWRLIGEAYALSQPLPRNLIQGGPDWIDTERFDVEGVAQTPLTRERARVMLRTVLRQRFKLDVHIESREAPIYALVMARGDGKLGPQLKRATAPCSARAASGQTPSCAMGFGFGRLTANGLTMSDLATTGLSRFTDRTVVDHTGLTGPFDWTLVWTPDNLPQRPPGTPPDQPLTVNGLVVDPKGPNLFTALQEQLSLKLESARGPVDVVVIDHIERPIEN